VAIRSLGGCADEGGAGRECGFWNLEKGGVRSPDRIASKDKRFQCLRKAPSGASTVIHGKNARILA
jgi:hypothetical protein